MRRATIHEGGSRPPRHRCDRRLPFFQFPTRSSILLTLERQVGHSGPNPCGSKIHDAPEQTSRVISITPLSYALSPGGSVGPPLPTLLPVRAQSYKSSSPGLGCQGPVKVVTYDPDLLAVNRPEVPTNPRSGWLGLLEWLAEFRRTFYSLDHWFIVKACKSGTARQKRCPGHSVGGIAGGSGGGGKQLPCSEHAGLFLFGLRTWNLPEHLLSGLMRLQYMGTMG